MATDTKLTEEQIAAIREDFDFFDRDNNGHIDIQEFIELLSVLSPKTKVSHVEEGFSLIDENGDGHIDFEEFLAWWQTNWFEY